MNVARLVVGLAIALLLSACSLPAAPSAEGEGGLVDPAGSTGLDALPRPIPEFLAYLQPDGLTRISFAAGDRIDRAGAYFLDVTTGLGEGWLPAGEPGYWYALVSEENRFITTSSGDEGYLVDRESGLVWAWKQEEFRLLLADEAGFLFAEVGAAERNGIKLGTGRLFWAGPEMKIKGDFDLGPEATWVNSAHRSPDGSRVAVHYGQGEAALLILDSGEVQRLQIPAGEQVSVESLRRHGDLLRLDRLYGHPNRQGWTEEITYFNWQGEQVERLSIPGLFVTFSPDGKWVTWVTWPVGGLAPMTVVADAISLEPHLQALGATTFFPSTGGGGYRWLSDNSALVVDTSAGYRLLTLEGELQELPAFAGLGWKGEPQPAPDRPDRFAIGRLVVTDGTGAHPVGVSLEGFVTPASLPPWGSSSSELRFVLPPKPAGGACEEVPPMETRVIAPARPLPEYPLVVQGVTECLRLSPVSGEATCLPNGTRLAVAAPWSDRSSVDWFNGSWWLWVRTEGGLVGRVSLAEEPLGWAVD